MITLQFKEQMMQELQTSLYSIDEDQVQALAQAILDADRIFLTGGGRAGLMARAIAMRLTQMGLRVYMVGDVTTTAISADDLLIVASGKARTATSAYYARKAKEQQAKVALLTANPMGEIAKLADYILTIIAPVGKEEQREACKSIQIMGNRFEQSLLLTGDLIVMEAMQLAGISEDSMRSRHANLE